MENVNWLKLKLNQKKIDLQSAKANINADLSSAAGNTKNLVQTTQNKIINQFQQQFVNPQQLRMNNLASIDRAVYVKNLLNLPKNMVELLVMVQNNGKMPTLQNTQNNSEIQQNPALNQTQENKQTQPNQQFQLPEQQSQKQPVQEQLNNRNQQQSQPETSQKQASADKDLFNQQLNNAKQNSVVQDKPQTAQQIMQNQQQQTLQTNQQLLQNQKQIAQNVLQNNMANKPDSEQLPQQNNSNAQNIQNNAANRPNINSNSPQNPNINKPQINNPPFDKPNHQPELPPNNNRPNISQNPNINRPQINNPPFDKPNHQPELPPNNNRPHVPQNPNINRPQINNPPFDKPNHQPELPPNNNRPHVPQNPKPQHPNHFPEMRPDNPPQKPNINPSQIKENISNNLNNIKENVQNNAEQFIQNTKHNIKNNSLMNPHNQLHNAVRNNVRNNPILNQQIAQDTDSVEQMQTNNQKTQGMTPEELAQFKQNLASQLNANVNLTNVSALLQRNSKIAMNKMVSMMTMATAQGMTDIQPLQDTINIINASVSANSQNDATQTLKNLMLLYLPWLPLQEGVGFDLEIEQDENMPESDTFIKILITTVNYGNLHATVSLITGNSVDISIICSEKFPKKELFKRLFKDGSQHSMQTTIDFREQKPQEQLDTSNPKAKVNLSNVNQVNPYLLLMSHAIIRHTIELDATISIGQQPIDD